MANYEKLAQFVIDNVGGKANIVDVTHCLTRLRIKLADEGKVNTKALENEKGIVGLQNAEGRLQIIIGTHVGDVYEVVQQLLGRKEAPKVDQEKGSLMNRIMSKVTKIIIPTLGVLCACGMVMGLKSILTALGIITTESGAYQLLDVIGNTALNFFPILLGYTCANAFGYNPFIGIVLGAILVYPGITELFTGGEVLFTLFEGTFLAMPVYKTFFGIPIIFPMMGYTSTMLPIVFISLFASVVEKWCQRHIPNAVKLMFVPLVTILVSAICGILVIGPVINIIQTLISVVFILLTNVSMLLTMIIMAIAYQPLVIFGLHWAMIAVGMVVPSASGQLLATMFPASFAYMGTCLAVYLRTKSNRVKNVAFPAFVSSCFCIIEPAIYGVALPVRKRFLFCILGGVAGTIVMYMTGTQGYNLGALGIMGFPGYINPETNAISGALFALLAALVSMGIAFFLTCITYKRGEDGEDKDELTGSDSIPMSAEEVKELPAYRKEEFLAPVAGTIKPLEEMTDQAFSKLGKGLCIIPREGKIVAPCDGILTTMFPTGHALGITSKYGAEIIIHIGANTFHAPEGLFTKHKEEGDRIRAGELLISFDLEQMRDLGMNDEIAVLITNTDEYLDIIELVQEETNSAERLISAVALEEK